MELYLSTNEIKCKGGVLSFNGSDLGGYTLPEEEHQSVWENPSNFSKSDPLRSESTRVLVGEKDVGNYADLNQLHK